MLRLCALHLAATVLLVVANGCSEGAPAEESATPPPRDERDRPIRVLDLDLDACDREPAGDPRLRVTAHEAAAGEYVASIEVALGKAIDHAGAVYRWTPRQPLCVHLFASDEGFLQGLQQLAGWAPRLTYDYSNNGGTVGRDVATGQDAVYIKLTVRLVREAENWAAYIATHEYYHVVEWHIGGTNGGRQDHFPTWFLEGMADWEATKQEGHPHPWWLTSLLAEERAGRALLLGAFVTWDQWRRLDIRRPLYWKARAALMYLEELAGPSAAYEILSLNAGGNLSRFETAFEEVSGLTLAEFEAGFLPFLERLAAAHPPVGLP